MKLIVVALLCGVGLSWAVDGRADDAISPLDNDKIEIRSMLDPDVVIQRTQPVSVLLPANATLADKQLVQLIKYNLLAQGFVVTTPDKSDWTIYATERDESSTFTYSKPGFFTWSSSTATVSWATIQVVVVGNNDPSVPVWMSTVFTLNDFWVNNQEAIVKAIIATYGINFYIRNEKPKDVLEDVANSKYQPNIPTLEQLKHCMANPKADGC